MVHRKHSEFRYQNAIVLALFTKPIAYGLASLLTNVFHDKITNWCTSLLRMCKRGFLKDGNFKLLRFWSLMYAWLFCKRNKCLPCLKWMPLLHLDIIFKAWVSSITMRHHVLENTFNIWNITYFSKDQNIKKII